MAKVFEVKYFEGDTLDTIQGLTATNTGSVTINHGEKGQYLSLGTGKYLTYSATPLPASGALSVVAFARCGLGSALGTRHMAVLSDTAAGTARSFSIGMNTTVNRATIDMASPNYRTFIWSQDYKWHCFVFTLPGSAESSISSSAFYVDGVSQAVSSTAVGTLTTRANTKLVGGTDGSGAKGADVLYLAVHDTVLTQQEIDLYVAQFNRLIGQDKPKRGFLVNKPNDLSKEVNNTLGADVVSGWDFTNWTPTSTGSVTDNNTFVANAAGDGIYKVLVTVGKRYRINIQGDMTGGAGCQFAIWNSTSISNLVGVVLNNSGTFNQTLDFTAVATELHFRVGTNSATVNVSKFTIQELSGLVAAYNMKPNGLTLTDISGNGYNGTLGNNIVSTQNGLMASGSINGLLIRDGAIITTTDHSIIGRIKLNTLMSGDGVLFTNDNSTANTIVDSIGISNGQIAWNYDPSGTYKNGSTRTLAVGRWYDFALTISGGRTGTVKLYIDGVEDTITTTGYYRSGGDVKLFNRSGGSVPFYGECADLRIYNRALSLQEVKDYHNSFAKQPYLVEDFSDLPCDGNAVVPRDWTKVSGSFKGGEISIASGEQIGDTNFSGNGFWQAVNGAVISGNKLTLDANGSYVQDSLNAVKTPGKRYRVTMNIESISGTVSIYAGNSTNGNAAFTTTGVQTKEFTYIGISTTNRWVIYSATAAVITNVSLVEIDPLPTLTKGSKYLECVTAGIIAIPSNQLAGTWEWDWYKGADANTSKFNFIAPNFAGDGLSSMTFYVDNSENLLLRVSNSTIASTATSYLQNFTWYRVRVTRTTAGFWTMLIKGGAFTPTAGYDGWTLISTTGGTGTNPIINTVISSSIYLLFDIDAGDRFTNLKLTNGVIQ